MHKLLFLSHWRYLLQHRLQTALAVLGIALGVTVVVAINLTISSANNSFRISYQQVAGSSTHQIQGGSQGISEVSYRRLRSKLLPYYNDIHAAPVIQRHVNLYGQPEWVLQVLAIDPIAEMTFRRYLGTESVVSEEINTDFMLRSNTVLLSHYTARQLGLNVGDQLDIESNGQALALNIIGLIGDVEDSQYSNLLVMDIGNAQDLFDAHGSIDHIDLKVNEADEVEFIQRLQPLLPVAARLVDARGGFQRTVSLTDAFEMNLQALGLLALLVGIFLIYNTMNGFVVQRGVLFGRMRALGVSQRQIYAAILSEVLLVGSAGTALGLPLAIYLAQHLLLMASQTINDHYYVTTVTQLYLSPFVLMKGVGVGIGATFIAGWAPARRAANTSACQQLQRIAQEQSALQFKRYYAYVALVLVLIGSGFFYIEASGVFGGFVTIVCLLLIAALITPSLIAGVTKIITRLSLPLPVKMALRGTGRNLSRTSVAAMALLIAVASTNGIGTMVESFRYTVSQWMQARINADIYVRPMKSSSIHQRQFVPGDIVEKLQQHEGLLGVSLFIDFPTSIAGEAVELMAAELPPSAQRGYQFLPQWPSSSEDAIWQGFYRGELLISEPLANKRKLAVGDNLVLDTDRGPQPFRIAAVFYDYGSEHGRLLMQRSHLLKYYDRPGVEAVGLYLSAEQKADATFVQTLQQELKSSEPLVIGTSERVLEIGLAIFDRTFAITNLLRALALMVALVGMFGALTVLQLEQARELATLKALGFSTGQILTQQLSQAALLGGFVGVLAIPLGMALAWLLIDVINLRAFGWSMLFQPLWTVSLQNLGFAVLVAVIASLYPTWYLTRQSSAEALRQE